jgi:hypothetical protein
LARWAQAAQSDDACWLANVSERTNWLAARVPKVTKNEFVPEWLAARHDFIVMTDEAKKLRIKDQADAATLADFGRTYTWSLSFSAGGDASGKDTDKLRQWIASLPLSAARTAIEKDFGAN